MTTTTLHRQERSESPKLLLTAREAAASLSISERSLWSLTNQGILGDEHQPLGGIEGC